jgi:chromosome segregation ATPase
MPDRSNMDMQTVYLSGEDFEAYLAEQSPPPPPKPTATTTHEEGQAQGGNGTHLERLEARLDARVTEALAAFDRELDELEQTNREELAVLEERNQNTLVSCALLQAQLDELRTEIESLKSLVEVLHHQRVA